MSPGERSTASEQPLPAEAQPVDPDLAAGARRPPTGVTERPPRPRQWDVLLVIAFGGGLGSIARYGLARAWPTRPGGLPWATLVTNVGGCLLIGLLMVFVLEVWRPSRHARPFLGVGILGGFTTFSTYTVELRGMLAAHHWSLANAYALGSLVAGLAAVWTGIALARMVAGLPVRRGPRRRAEAGRTVTAPRRSSTSGTDLEGERP
ncbi:fluoride efflux transporter FluC [Kitasatospora sp. NPDC052896]|uniref:fluoride efflux transporter FluC n=1 Tax=Kitasatospora sp. NPDC052896 TaxID=3364061 RepID=UPI0037C77FB6